MLLYKSLIFSIFLFLTNISLAQEKTFQILPFDLTFTEGHQAPCEGMEMAKINKNSTTEYFFDHYFFEINVGTKFKLYGKDIQNISHYYE
jgi:hypothetical protein